MVPEKIENPEKAVKWYDTYIYSLILGVILSLGEILLIYLFCDTLRRYLKSPSYYEIGDFTQWLVGALILLLIACFIFIKDKYYYKYVAIRISAFVSSIVTAVAVILMLYYWGYLILLCITAPSDEALLYIFPIGLLLVSIMTSVTIVLFRRVRRTGGLKREPKKQS